MIGKNLSSPKEIDQFLQQVKTQPKTGHGRIVFGLDATFSRQPTWDRACQVQGEMFQATHALGPLSIQLVFYRGFNECKASSWITTSDRLRQLMSGVTCLGGLTQIHKILAHIRRQSRDTKINAAIFIGDALEENGEALCHQAGQLGLLNIPLFIFQEGANSYATSCFQQMAKLSGGVHCFFDSDSPEYLKTLLGAVATYALAGPQAVQAYNPQLFLAFQKS